MEYISSIYDEGDGEFDVRGGERAEQGSGAHGPIGLQA